MIQANIYCAICGKEFNPTQIPTWGFPYTIRGSLLSRLCSSSCFKEAEHREILIILRKDYYPNDSR